MKKHSVPRVYQDVCLKQGTKFYDYENMELKFQYKYIIRNCSDFELIQKIGRGKYSDVFEAINVKNDQIVVIKMLKPSIFIYIVRKKKILREIKVLQNISQIPNAIKLLSVIQDPSSKTVGLVFEYVKNVEYKVLYPTLTDMDVRYYMFELIKTLDKCHSLGLIHRDIKPHNVMIDHEKRSLKLIDWGLAEFYFPSKDYNVRVSSRYFKGPELLLDFQYYDYSLDIWSLGCMFAQIIFMKEPFFCGTDNFDQLEKINLVLGTEDLMEYVNTYQLKIDPQFEGILGRHNKQDFKMFVKKENQHLANSQAIDLLQKMLVYDHQQRLTASELLKEPYFAQFQKKSYQY